MLRVKYLTRNIVAGQIFDPQHLHAFVGPWLVVRYTLFVIHTFIGPGCDTPANMLCSDGVACIVYMPRPHMSCTVDSAFGTLCVQLMWVARCVYT